MRLCLQCFVVVFVVLVWVVELGRLGRVCCARRRCFLDIRMFSCLPCLVGGVGLGLVGLVCRVASFAKIFGAPPPTAHTYTHPMHVRLAIVVVLVSSVVLALLAGWGGSGWGGWRWWLRLGWWWWWCRARGGGIGQKKRQHRQAQPSQDRHGQQDNHNRRGK